MAIGRGEKIDGAIPPHRYGLYVEMWPSLKPWQLGYRRFRSKPYRNLKHRRERRRAKLDPECTPEYNRYHGWET
jgi:hypothetical protein